MSFLMGRPEQSTTAEATLLAALNSLSASGSGEFLRKTGAASFENSTPSGGGSVTSVSVTAANGVSASVATATTTPALTFTLGDITPSSVVSSGVLTGTAITGTSFVIGANTLTTTEWAFLDGQNQAVLSTSSPTFVNLTITSFAANWTNAGRTVADMGILTTVDINGGTLDGVIIGGASAAAATITTLTITSFAANWTNAGRTVADMGILTTVDINGGTLDGVIIGGAATAAITATTIDATTDFTIGTTVITDDTIVMGTTANIVNTVSTTVNLAGAATALNIGAAATCILNFGGSTTASEFRFLEPSGSGTNYSAFKAVAQAASITYSLPPAVGAAGTVLTDAVGDGVLTWATAGGSSDPDLIRLIGNDSTIEGLPIAVAQDLKDAYVGYGSTNVARAIGFGGVGGVFLLNAQTSALGAVDTLCMVVVGSNVFYSRVSGAGSLFRNNRALSAQATMSFSGGTPTAIARMGSDGTSLYIQDGATSTTIKKYSISGDTATFVSNITLDATPDALGGHAQPFGVDSSGNMYICMKSSAVAENQIVRKFDSSGVTQNTVTWTLNSASQSLIGTAVSDGGTIYVVVDHNSATGERDVYIAKIAFS